MMGRPAEHRPRPRKKVGKTRRTIGFVVFLVLIGVFVVVMINRIRNPKVIIVPSEEDAWDDSLAQARAGLRTGRGTQRKARRKRVLDAYNRMGAEVDQVHQEWQAALSCQPSGTISLTDAYDCELRVRDAYPRLRHAERLLRSINDRVAAIGLAFEDAETETEAGRIERMHAAAEALAQNLSDRHEALQEYLEALEEEMSLFGEGEDYSGPRAQEQAAWRRAGALGTAADRCIDELHKAADNYLGK